MYGYVWICMDVTLSYIMVPCKRPFYILYHLLNISWSVRNRRRIASSWMFNQTSQLTMVSWEETMALESWHFCCLRGRADSFSRAAHVHSVSFGKEVYCLMMSIFYNLHNCFTTWSCNVFHPRRHSCSLSLRAEMEPRSILFDAPEIYRGDTGSSTTHWKNGWSYVDCSISCS